MHLLADAGLHAGARVLDVGGGSARLAAHLLELGFSPAVLDISARALEESRARLGDRAGEVEWIRSSILDYRAETHWDAWHDRAMLHFLTDDEDRSRYAHVLAESLAPGGIAVLAAFGPQGPQRCSGLPVRRYDVEALTALVGRSFELETTEMDVHRTPDGSTQQFVFARLRRR